ncbi:MAG: prepilin-type N-terminal cleavage/methylation domain-containing protein [Synechococcaceae cyanobacterium]|nr:prepilin-type N-terminal cleavage/methylation domain-containing protein [Synechococcaceae cyanobacterium]
MHPSLSSGLPAMLRRLHQLRPAPGRPRRGFSLIEVMLACVLLLLSVAGLSQLFTRSQMAIRSLSLRDAVHARIDEDIALLRRASIDYACAKWDDDNPSLSCLSYKTAGSTVFSSACSSNSVAQAMLSGIDDTVFSALISSSTLAWPADSDPAAVPGSIRAITITRTVSQPLDNGSLLLTYTTGAPLDITVRTILVPQAQAFCPGPDP